MRIDLQALKDLNSGTGIDSLFRKVLIEQLELLDLRVRKIELERMSFNTTERHELTGEATDAERERVAEERWRERHFRAELADVEARLARWGS